MKLMRNTNDILQTELLSIKTRADTSNIEISLSAHETDENTETNELRKHASTLNELLKNMKKEKDLQDAQIERIEVERDTANSTLAATQRALDEAKASLIKEQEKKGSMHTDEEYDRLKTEVGRVTLLQDSNAYLHQQKGTNYSHVIVTIIILISIRIITKANSQSGRRVEASKNSQCTFREHYQGT